MGYYTNFKITLYREIVSAETINEDKRIFDEIETESGYTFDSINDEEATLNEASWSDAVEDVATVAKKHPGVIIELIGEGEDRHDDWIARFCGDKYEIILAAIEWPEFKDILTPEEATPKARYQRFQKALNTWLDFQETTAHQDALKRLRESPVDLTQYDFGKNPYFFIGPEAMLYCHKAMLGEDGKLRVEAGETDDPNDNTHILDWESMSQDLITLNDFMDCIYGNVGNYLDED